MTHFRRIQQISRLNRKKVYTSHKLFRDGMWWWVITLNIYCENFMKTLVRPFLFLQYLRNNKSVIRDNRTHG